MFCRLLARSYEQRTLHPAGVFGVEMSLEFHIRDLKENIDEYLERRDEFWDLLGQVTLSIVVALLAGLLMMNKIEADAGLPILSAIVTSVVGKGIGVRTEQVPLVDGVRRRVSRTL